jgi:PST family polysaccharide transporter
VIPGADIGRRVAKGAAWMVSLRLTVRLIGLLNTVILARLLVPEDFGLVALATMFMGALEVFSHFGFDVVLIRDQDSDTRLYNTAWTLSIIRGIVLAILLLVLAAPAGAFLEDARLEGIIYFLAFATFADGIQNIGVVDFRKKLMFHKEFVYMVSEKIGMVAITIPLALLWRDYWALVAGIIAGRWIRVTLSYVLHAYRPRPSLAHWREIIGFSKWLLMNNMFQFIYSRADTFVIGKLLGATSVGLYSVAYELSNLATSELVAPIRRAIYPGYAQLVAHPDQFKKSFLDSFALIVALATPIAAGIGLTAEPMVWILLGEKWLDAIPLMRILAFYGLIVVCTANAWPALIALGRPQVVAWISLGSAVVLVPLLIYAVSAAGTVGAAWAVTFMALLQLTVTLSASIIIIGISLGAVARTVWRTTAAIAAMALVVFGMQTVWPHDHTLVDQALALVSYAGVGAAIRRFERTS